MALLGELSTESGTVNVTGKIAYVSQEAWIFNGTLKNNITFGQELDERKYQRVIEICALQRASFFYIVYFHLLIQIFACQCKRATRIF